MNPIVQSVVTMPSRRSAEGKGFLPASLGRLSEWDGIGPCDEIRERPFFDPSTNFFSGKD